MEGESSRGTNGQVALSSFTASQTFSNLVCDLMFTATRDGSIADGVLLEFDRHCGA